MRNRSITHLVLTALSDAFFVWVLFHYGLGGWESAITLLTQFGPLPWFILGAVLFLAIYRSDWRMDLPLFIAGWILGYWGEWWGTTRGVWTYWNGAQPPDYLPPLWGVGLLTVYRLGMSCRPLIQKGLLRWTRWVMGASFMLLPLAAFVLSWSHLVSVDWHGRLDLHFIAGLVVAASLILNRFDLRQDFPIFICGTLLGGFYEYLGTSSGEWTYITGEVPPLWIAPLWGLSCVAMTKLAYLLYLGVEKFWRQRAINQRI